MSLFSQFTYKSDGSPLTTDQDFIDAVSGTQFEKSSGVIYSKISGSTNIFDRSPQTILTTAFLDDRYDDRYVNFDGDDTLTGNFIPAITLSSELGSATKLWNKIYGNTLNCQYSENNFTPATGNVYDLGESGKAWKNGYINNLYAPNIISNVVPETNEAYNLGNSSRQWNNVYTKTLHADQYTGNIIASGSYDIGSTATRWNNLYIENLSTNTVSTNLIPNVSNTHNLGSAGNKWAQVHTDTLYASKLNGTMVPSANTTYNLGSSSAKWSNIYATNFQGVATSAKYADLAERYDGDKEYEIGTVVEVGGANEITLFNGGALAGVISENPGFRLNDEGAGQFVALKGKVPVKCSEPIEKGQYCIAQNGGTVIGAYKTNMNVHNPLDIVGVALENSQNGMVMVKV